jgi:N-acetylmuramoyl-L-alanine amidase
MVKIMLDPGHDESTPGKGVAGLKEFTFNKAVALKMEVLLKQYENVQVIMSHDLNDGIDQSLASRAKKGNDNNVDAVISIHANAAKATSARGIETFVHPKAPKADRDFATVVQKALISATEASDRGVKTADFQILRDTKTGIPVCLTELGFMTNPEDFKLLISDDYRNTVAQALTDAVATFLKLKRKPNKDGWVQESGKWYFYKDGTKQTSWIKDAGKHYFLDKHGIMQTGWIKWSGKWYFLLSSGAMATGVIEDKGKLYYLQSDGSMVANTRINVTLSVGADGALKP